MRHLGFVFVVAGESSDILFFSTPFEKERGRRRAIMPVRACFEELESIFSWVSTWCNFGEEEGKRHMLKFGKVFGRTVIFLWDEEEEKGH